MNSEIQEIERSITKTFKKTIWSKFVKGINKYELIKEGDKIAVCISGGKDSMLMAKSMQLLQRYSDFPFEVVYLVMDPGYNAMNRQRIEENAERLGLPIHVFESDIFKAVEDMEKSPCYMCAKMRRGHLYKNAKMLGCNKIALGHHYDDVIETTMMSMLYGAEIRTMIPKLHSANYEGMELIRPMYLIREASIIEWMKANEFRFIQCACRFTENCSINGQGGGSKRAEMKALIKKMQRTNPDVAINIFNSMHNVNLDAIDGYRKNGVKHSFTEDYVDAKPMEVRVGPKLI